MAADSDYSDVLERLADSHQQRIADSLVALEERVAVFMSGAPVKDGKLFDLEWAVNARAELRSALDETYLSEVDSVLRSYGGVSTAAEKMLGTYGDFTKLDAGVVSQLQRLSFQGFEDIGSEYLDTLASEVYQSTLTGRNFNDTVKNLRQTINGVYINSDDAEAQRLVDVAANGTAAQSAAAVKELQTKYARDRVGNNLRRYSTQMAQDSLMQFDASINTAIGKQSGASKWKYYGSTVRDSRPFCVEHAGQVFTDDEIEETWSGSWKGKASGDPFIVRGGYNCRHHWRPVFDEEPEAAKDAEEQEATSVSKTAPVSSKTPELVSKQAATAALNSRVKKNNVGTRDSAVTDKYISYGKSEDLPAHLSKLLDDKDIAGNEFPVRFKPYGYKRGIDAEKLGNQQFGTANLKGLSSESLSLLSQSLKETDGLALKFKVPAIRGVMPVSGRAAASMGDGVLGVNSSYWNPIAKKAYTNPQKLIQDTAKAKLKKDAAEEYYETLKNEYLIARDAFYEVDRSNAELALFREKIKLVNAANADFKKANKAYLKSKAISDVDVESIYLKGGNINDRPFSVKQYYTEPADKFRSTMYHEFGHTVHQEYWRKVTDKGSTPFERYLDNLFYVNGKSGAKRKSLFFPSKYSETNPHEWWAENFSLYNMGRKDLVDDKLIELMDEMVKSKGRIKTFDNWNFEEGREI